VPEVRPGHLGEDPRFLGAVTDRFERGERLPVKVATSPATALRMPSRVEANPWAQVKPRARLLAMLSVIHVSPASRSNPSSPKPCKNAPMQSSRL
jgi:hypothetical protein